MGDIGGVVGSTKNRVTTPLGYTLLRRYFYPNHPRLVRTGRGGYPIFGTDKPGAMLVQGVKSNEYTTTI